MSEDRTLTISKHEVVLDRLFAEDVWELAFGDNAFEAWELVDKGNWDESMVIKKKIIDRQTCDVEEAGSFERLMEDIKDD